MKLRESGTRPRKHINIIVGSHCLKYKYKILKGDSRTIHSFKGFTCSNGRICWGLFILFYFSCNSQMAGARNLGWIDA